MPIILCYGDSNTWGAVPITDLARIDRYAADVRWPGVMRRALGPECTVYEDGLNGRTTVFDDPIEGAHKNGRSQLEASLETHMPCDLVILMLGTNDFKTRFGVSAFDIAMGAGALVDDIRRPGPARERLGPVPKVLLVAPAPLGPQTVLKGLFAGREAASRELGGYLGQIAELKRCGFLDAAEHIQTSRVDATHLDADQHGILGVAMARSVREMFGNTV